ncbi:MAG TPA: pitrilysin family protein [Vicinamibacterales bacterium]|nr:pitrilysin family protein [Vicinamibacterales bacterium]
MTRARLLAFVLTVATALPAAAQNPNWPSERPPRPLAAHEVKFPPYNVRTLANGLQVIAVSHHEQPAVSLRLIVRAGGAQDPAEKPGVAALAAALLDQGTTSKDAEKIATTIDSIGGALGTGAGSDLTFIQAVVMKDSLNLALDLVSDVARHPAFAQDEVDRQRQQMLSGLKVSYDDPDYLAGVVFDRLVYGFHPYGRPDAGTPQSIASITRDDLLKFHKTWFGANNAILAIVGDVSPEEAFAGAERAFGDWQRTPSTPPKPADPPPATRRVIVIDRPGAVQTEIRVGNIGLPRKHPDYLALDLAIKILGGEGGNRLHRVLRSERGLTYGASADINALKDSGDIVADTDTRSETTGEALRLIVDEFWRLQRQRVSERELSDAQAYLTGSFPLTIETPSAIALQVLNAVFYGLDLNDLQTFRERVNAVTPDDIQRVAREYLRPDRLSIVLVGDASVFAKQLPALGFDQVERIPLAELDLASADLRRHATPAGRIEQASFRVPAPQTAPAAGQSVRELIDRAVQAKGGLEKLRSVRTVKAVSTLTLVNGPAERPVDLPTTTLIRYPASFRLEAETPNGPLIQVFDNGEFWASDKLHGTYQPPEKYVDEMRGTVQRDAINLLVALADGKVSATRVADVMFHERPHPAIDVRGPMMKPVTVILDPSSGLIVAQRYEQLAGRAAEIAEEEFLDYRNVDGLQVAFEAVLRRGGQSLVRRSLKTIEYNVALDPTLFTKPS